MDVNGKTALVIGGSRGLGLGIVEALAAHGAKVTVVARTAKDLKAVEERLKVATVTANFTDQAKAARILASVKPDILIISAGAPPIMAPLDEQTWESFSNTWNTDVKGALYWVQAALRTPLAPGARVLLVSSGAAVAGSPMTGGYAGAKRMTWLMANYANSLAAERNLDVRFQTVIPRQQFAGTGIGDVASSAYSAKLGISPADYLTRFGRALAPREFGELVLRILMAPEFENASALNIKGDTGVTVYAE